MGYDFGPKPLGPPQTTPFHLAAGAGHIEVVEQLLEAGADATRTDFDDMTAMDLARKGGHENVVKLLAEHGQNP